MVYSQNWTDTITDLPKFNKFLTKWLVRDSAKNFHFIPYIFPTTNPESEFTFNLGAAITFRTDRNNPNLKRSSLPTLVGYSINNSFYAHVICRMYFLNNKLRLWGDFWVIHRPDHYWGVGYEAGAKEGKTEENQFLKTYWRLNPYLDFEVFKNLYLGIRVHYRDYIAKEYSEQMASDPYFQEYGHRNFESGIGFGVDYDTRDQLENPWSGYLLRGRATFFNTWMGGTDIYQHFSLEYRHFVSLVKGGGRTLALRALTRITTGKAPYSHLSELGGLYEFRGYYQGRFRDNNDLLFTLEYRHQFKRRKSRRHKSIFSRNSAVVWVGTASVSPDYKSFTYWLVNGGIGYRFMIAERVNFRVDFGIGMNSTGFYGSVLEAF